MIQMISDETQRKNEQFTKINRLHWVIFQYQFKVNEGLIFIKNNFIINAFQQEDKIT